ncbi:MAG: hypothetical protein GX304_03770 [Clostridiales bacterium]|nr:hypothetical protein [Clostridiales bacterium]
MRRKNKKLIFSILGLIIAAAVAVTSTYAWLSMNSTSTIEGFNIDIGNNRKLLISFTGEEGSYKAYMTSADIQDYLAGKYGEDFSLYPAQSADGIAISGLGGEEASYISFDLYFQSNVKSDIYLDANPDATYVRSSRKSGSGVGYVRAWKDIPAGSYGQHGHIQSGQEIVAHAKDAVRISFMGQEGAVIWYPNPHTGYNKDINLHDEPGFEPKNLALDYLNEVYGYSLAVPEYYLNKNFSTNFYNPEAGNYIITDKLLSLEYDEEKEAYCGRLIVNIWLEGWDGDCFDSITEDILTIGMQFNSLTMPQQEEPEEPGEDPGEEPLPDYPLWESNKAYQQGSYVIHNGRVFYARYYAKAGDEPGIVGHPWQEVTDEWRPYNLYEEGDEVIYNGRRFRARYYTVNEEPGLLTSPWQEITDEWRPFNVYEKDDVVIHNGSQFYARQDTKNQEPGLISSPWQEITDEWRPYNVYLKNDEVCYNGSRYRAKYWTQNDPPDENPNIWQKI